MPVVTSPPSGDGSPLTVPREAVQRFASLLLEGRFWLYLIAWVLIIGGVLEVLSTVWLYLIAWLLSIGGVLEVLSIVGIIFPWIPIWTGIVLLQVAARLSTAQATGEAADFAQLLTKLRLYFMITGISTLIWIIFLILGLLYFGTFFAAMMAHGAMYGMHP